MRPDELLELLLTYAIPRRDTRPLARRLLAGGSLGALLVRSPERLAEEPGLGEHSASLLALVARIHRVLQAEADAGHEVLRSIEEVVPWMRAEIGLAEEERFAAVFVDQGGRILGRKVFEGGSRTRTTIFPRTLFGEALRMRATGLVLGHNHPGDNLRPSEADRELTRRLAALGRELEVELLDHLVVTRRTHASLRGVLGY